MATSFPAVLTNLQFERLNSALSLFTPPLTSPDPGHKLDPTTIIILQWMGASPKSRSLNSIYRKYHSIYPQARIISARSLPEWFMTTSTSTRLATLKPIVLAIKSDTAPEPRILVHLFSNGGSLALVDICTLYRAQSESFAANGIILDSAPGQPSITEAWAAMSVGLPKGILWYPSAAVVISLFGIVGISKWAFGGRSIVDKVYDDLNNFDLTDKSAARLYIYSEADKLVNFMDVERHMKKADESGLFVTSLKEYDTPHVQHIILDGERYWNEVEKFWGTAKDL